MILFIPKERKVIVENMNRKIYSAVDVAKFLFSICIVILHTEVYQILPYPFSYYIEKGILRLAVPFFFCVSGFFLGKKLYWSDVSEYEGIIKKYVFRLLKPLIFFEFINILLESIKMLIQRIAPYDIARDIIWHICFYPYGALWYIQASILGIMISYPFLVKKKINLALLIGSFCYLFALLANTYYFFIEEKLYFIKDFIDKYLNLCISARNGIFVGFFLLSVGIKLYEIYVRIKFNRGVLAFVGILCYFLYLGEVVVLKDLHYADDGALFLTHIALIPLLLLNLLCCKAETENTIILRNLSTGIYLLHRIIISLLLIAASQGKGISHTLFGDFVIVLGGCIIICLIAYKSKSKFLSNLLK